MKASEPVIGLVTGGFDPLHRGHLAMIADAAQRCDHLMVGVNRDEWLVAKKGFRLLDEQTRLAVLKSIRGVTMAFVFKEDSQNGAANAVRFCRETFPTGHIVLMNGGDRNEQNIPSLEAKEADEVIFGVGGSDKAASSSDIFLGALQSFKAGQKIS